MYDLLGNPYKIIFVDGSEIEYEYAADGKNHIQNKNWIERNVLQGVSAADPVNKVINTGATNYVNREKKQLYKNKSGYQRFNEMDTIGIIISFTVIHFSFLLLEIYLIYPTSICLLFVVTIFEV